MTRIEAIKTYFASAERPVENAEIMKLSKEQRTSLGDGALKALGQTLTETGK